ncbi:CDP-glycerol glycerophosphotransferase family protein [Flexivirga sp. B27]
MSSGHLKFSVVVPLYRTEKYLGELLESFDSQQPGDYDTEFIFVDDGSDDSSGEIARTWLDRSGVSGTVIRQDNAGVSSARNRGMAEVTGEWITFPDSDDLLSANYFKEAARAVAEAGTDVALLTANVWRYDEATGNRQDVHPLRHKFQAKHQFVDLQDRPTFIQTQAASGFFRLDVIREHDLSFIEGLRVAEDAVFASTYLLRAPSTLLVPLNKSIYYYRRRKDATSAADSYRTNDDFYFGRFSRGYLPLLELAEQLGGVPRWLENIVLYDLGWYFPREMNRDRKAIHLTTEQKAQAIALLQDVLGHIDPASIVNYRLTGMSPEIRALMLTLGGHPLPEVGTVRISKNVKGSFELCYLFQGERPHEVIESDGRPVTPLAAKTRKLDYFGQDLLHERIIRLPELADVGITLDGKRRLFQYGNYYLGSSEATAARQRQRQRPKAPGKRTPLWKQVAVRAGAEAVCWTKAPVPLPVAVSRGVALRRKRYRTFIRDVSKAPRIKHKYDGAWLIMDRVASGHDNGEYLYEYLRTERPDINAWFVVKKGTPEWDRLRERGFRLIGYRSLEHQLALQRAAVVASSQLDVEAIVPVPLDFYPQKKRPWRFVYLQHGVLQHNLAHWFNGKDIDLLTTASVDEHESIVADEGSYRLTSDSVVLTGFPRHDVVLEAAAKHPYDERRMVLIAPTWRNDLFLPKPSFAARRALRAPFLETDYGRNWMGLLEHPALRRLAEEGAQIVYLPHPNFRGSTPGVTYPDHVTVIESTPDIHELMSQARVTVTDYSSIFFDAALADSRIVYFQFDREAFLSGSHTYLPGYWDYEEHGFGPIATELEDAVRLTTEGYSVPTQDWPQLYRDRIARTLPLADGKSAARITALIEAKFQD